MYWLIFSKAKLLKIKYYAKHSTFGFTREYCESFLGIITFIINQIDLNDA